MISRRSLFALFGGAVAAPLAKVLPVEAAPVAEMDSFEYYDGWDALNTSIYYGGIDQSPNPWWRTRVYTGHAKGGPGSPLVCENHRTMIWPDECDCGPGMLLKDV